MTDKSQEALRALGQWLAKLRLEAGYSQWEFHPLTGYSRSTLSDAELGRHPCRREFWDATDKALRMNGQLVSAWELIMEMRQQERKERRKKRAGEQRRQKSTQAPHAASMAAACRNAIQAAGPAEPEGISPDVRVMSLTLVWSNGTATVLNTQKEQSVG